MLSNAYFFANFRFDTADNEPAKKCKTIQKIDGDPVPKGVAQRPALRFLQGPYLILPREKRLLARRHAVAERARRATS